MRVFITSINESTEQVCKWQLERLGFEVVLLNEVEPWIDKYKKFINFANDNCLRVDADVIVNKNILGCLQLGDMTMAQFNCYDFYKNDTGNTCPVYYGSKILEIIRQNLDKIDSERPETSAWRLPEVVKHTMTFDKIIYGSHGIGASKEMIERAKQNKIDRGQIADYDFGLVNKMREIQCQ